MKTKLMLFLFAVVAASSAPIARAGILDQLESAVTSSNSMAASVSALPESQVADGLKQALANGVTHAIASLGHDGGFLTNLTVKIPMPGKLQTVEKALRVAGQSQMADDFVDSMNHAAEQAVPVAASVFGDAIKQLTITDAKNILSGPDDAATQYFRKTTQSNLFTLFHPIVQKATDQVGVTQKYKQMTAKVASVNSFGGMFGSRSSVNFDEADIDTYITGKALDGLFIMVAQEEKNIRANPAARTTDLLKSVFGAATH